MIAARHLLLPAILVFPALAAGAGFDCTQAANAIERSICADPRVSELDEYLARYYAGARTAVKAGAACLQADQQEWLRQRNRCADRNCLENAYLDRLAELDALQPGVTALKNLQLPERSGLAWIIAPAADKVAAPPNPKAVPEELAGVLLDEVAGGDGFVLRSS